MVTVSERPGQGLGSRGNRGFHKPATVPALGERGYGSRPDLSMPRVPALTSRATTVQGLRAVRLRGFAALRLICSLVSIASGPRFHKRGLDFGSIVAVEQSGGEVEVGFVAVVAAGCGR